MHPVEDDRMPVAWQDWNDDLLERARRAGKPVLLSIECSWGTCCEDAERLVYGDAAVAELIARHCEAVRVDKDARPDLDAQYNRGGWPTTVLLDGDGNVLAGGSALTAGALAACIEQAAAVCRGEAPPAPPAPQAGLPGSGAAALDASIPPLIERALLADFDQRHGGFGTEHKFPHPEALDYALLRHAEFRNARLHEILEKTFSHMAAGQLQDHVEGGFFRYCARRDWSRPHTEKLLETNAGLARNYLEAGQLMGRADFLEVGVRTLEAMVRDLYDESLGLFHSGVAPDDEYYSLDAAERSTRRRPNRSGRMLADGNARAVSALLKAGAVLSRHDLTQRGVTVAESLLRRLWRRGKGMFHSHDGTTPQQNCYLRDQAETARALLHVLQYTDDRRFEAPLEELIELMASAYLDERGGFTSRSDGKPRVGRHDAHIVDGAVAAEVMLRAAVLLGRPSLAEIGTRALEHHAGDFRRHGYAMAAYGRSVELVLHPPLHIVVVGGRGERRSEELLRAASMAYLPSRVVQHLDPGADAEQLEWLRLPVRELPVAYVFAHRVCACEFTDPAGLPKGLAAANARRLED